MQYFGFDRPSFGFKTFGFGASSTPVAANFVTGAYTKGGAASTFNDTFTFSRDSVAWLFDGATINEYAKNAPRITSKGLLIEKESTNKIFPSSNLVNSKWRLQGSATSTTKGGVLPHTTLTNGGNSSNAVVFQIASVYAGDVMSQYVRGVEGADASLFTHFSYAKKVVLSTDWKRAYAKYTADAPYSDLYYAIDFRLGSVVSMDIFGVQVESGDVPSSIIPTTTAPVTRLADVLSLKSSATSVTGDWDSTLSLSIVNGQLTHTGYGYIRSLTIT